VVDVHVDHHPLGLHQHRVDEARGGEVVLHVNQRPPRASVDRDVLVMGDLEHPQHVGVGARQVEVARHGGDADCVEIRRVERERQREAVVRRQAEVGVEDDAVSCAGCGPRARGKQGDQGGATQKTAGRVHGARVYQEAGLERVRTG